MVRVHSVFLQAQLIGRCVRATGPHLHPLVLRAHGRCSRAHLRTVRLQSKLMHVQQVPSRMQRGVWHVQGLSPHAHWVGLYLPALRMRLHGLFVRPAGRQMRPH